MNKHTDIRILAGCALEYYIFADFAAYHLRRGRSGNCIQKAHRENQPGYKGSFKRGSNGIR